LYFDSKIFNGLSNTKEIISREYLVIKNVACNVAKQNSENYTISLIYPTFVHIFEVQICVTIGKFSLNFKDFFETSILELPSIQILGRIPNT